MYASLNILNLNTWDLLENVINKYDKGIDYENKYT